MAEHPGSLVKDTLVAVDPGTANAGVAVFVDGLLVDAYDLSYPTAEDYLACAPSSYRWVREKMRKRSKFRVAHKDLDAIERLMKHVARLRGTPWEREIYPFNWKSQIPKPQHHARIEKLLTPDEKVVWSLLGPDARDAVGIGLFILQRSGKGGTPGYWNPEV